MIDALIFLFIVFMVFTLLAVIFKDVYVFGVAGFLSIVMGIKVILDYGSSSDAWAFSIVGLSFFFFGIWLIIAGYQYGGKKKQ